MDNLEEELWEQQLKIGIEATEKAHQDYKDRKMKNDKNDDKTMTLVNWNSHCGLKMEKYNDIISYNPNILIIQECTKNDFDYIKNMWNYKNWYNDDLKNNNSEIGVAIFSDYRISFTEVFNRNFRYIIPYEITKNEENKFTIFAVWVNPIEGDYLKHFYEAINYYKDKKMLDNNSIIIGDFNIFANDNNKRLEKLEEELSPMINCTKGTDFYKNLTYYDSQYGYGIDDFCFVSKNIKDNYDIEAYIPSYKWDDAKEKKYRWNGLSDHCPIIVKIKFKS